MYCIPSQLFYIKSKYHNQCRAFVSLLLLKLSPHPIPRGLISGLESKGQDRTGCSVPTIRSGESEVNWHSPPVPLQSFCLGNKFRSNFSPIFDIFSQFLYQTPSTQSLPRNVSKSYLPLDSLRRHILHALNARQCQTRSHQLRLQTKRFFFKLCATSRTKYSKTRRNKPPPYTPPLIFSCVLVECGKDINFSFSHCWSFTKMTNKHVSEYSVLWSQW